MPTVAEIERLQALVDRLTPISTKHRGELIAADDWNLLVGALVEVGRAVLGDDADDGASPPHEHVDQVGVDWLDGRVRQLVTGGGLRDPAVESQLLKLRRDLATLARRLDQISRAVDTSRLRIDEVATNDLDREATLTRLSRRVLGAGDSKADVADLRVTLRTLQTEVTRAVEVGGLLEHNGQTIDVPGLVDRVSEVEALRDRLRAPDGTLLDASALEIRLQQLGTDFVRQGDLTSAIDEVRDDLRDADSAVLLDQARLAGREAAEESVGTLGGLLRSELAARLEGLGPMVNEAVSTATGRLREEVLAAARSEIERAVGRGDAAVREDLTQLLEQRLSATTALVERRLSGLPNLVGEQVAQQLDQQLARVLAGVERRLVQTEAAIASLDERITGNRGILAEAEKRRQLERRQDAATQSRLRSELLTRIGKVEDRLQPRVNAAVDDARSVLRTDLEATVGAVRRDLEGRLAEVARETAATEVKVLSTQVRTDLQSLVREEIGASLAAVRAEMQEEVAGLDRRVANLVKSQVTRFTSRIPQLVGRELEGFRPEIARMIDRHLNRPPRP